jgi:nuclear pore complex protein Nup155
MLYKVRMLFISFDNCRIRFMQAKESVRRAVESRNPQERQGYLGESLRLVPRVDRCLQILTRISRLFMKGARIMEFDKLREVIGDYQQLDFAKGAVELALYCAEALDADGLGKEYWQTVPPELYGQGHSNNAPDDPRRPSWERRARCYDLVLDSLETFENKVASGDDATERVRAHAYELVFASTDEIFHSRLYEWLISRGMADELLEVRKSHFYRSLTGELHWYTDATIIPASLSSMRAENA